jgi:hypothetical protein
MIIQIRGTSGSGKSTVMRKVMDLVGVWEPVYKEGRKQPLYYTSNGIVVLGHYNSPCGGCDTIGSARAVFDLIKSIDAKIIICEGLLLSEDVKWSSQLTDLRVIFLTTPLDQCLTWIAGRREKAGNDKPLNPSNTTNRVGVIERARMKLSLVGVQCSQCSAGKAPSVIISWIKNETR